MAPHWLSAFLIFPFIGFGDIVHPSAPLPPSQRAFGVQTLPRGNAWPETVLYRFQGGTDGSHPYSGLIFDKSGALYGTTSDGGSSSFGTVFKLAPSGSGYKESVLYHFQGTDGQTPHDTLIADDAGALYGTTEFGSANYRGTVFKLTPSGSGFNESVLYSFKGYPNDGQYPEAGLIADRKGTLYGTTYEGGTNGFGTVFKVAPSGAGYRESVLYSFHFSDGAYPYAGLTSGENGVLYGVTDEGGAYGYGTVFSLTPLGTTYSARDLYDFKGGSDGTYPYARLLRHRRNGTQVDELYGTTYGGGSSGCHRYGCGTVFKLTPSKAGFRESVLYRFQGYPSDGAYPDAGLIAGKSGALYGTTFDSVSNAYGTVFKLTPSGAGYKESLLYRFVGGNDGAYSWGGLVADKTGALYGSTFQGGGSGGGGGNGYGTVFKLTP